MTDGIAWFREARFGMFIHWGLYSLLKCGEWFDGSYFTRETLDADGMNALARGLQPGLLINDRSGAPEDFSTCENECEPAPIGRDWDMTRSSSWSRPEPAYLPIALSSTWIVAALPPALARSRGVWSLALRTSAFAPAASSITAICGRRAAAA